MKLWQIKIANWYFTKTEKFTVMEWFFLLLMLVLLFLLFRGFL